MHADIFKSKIAEHEKAGPGPSAGVAGQYNCLVRCDAAVFQSKKKLLRWFQFRMIHVESVHRKFHQARDPSCSEGLGVFGQFFGLIQGTDINNDHTQGVQILADPVIVNYEFIYRSMFWNDKYQ